MVTSGSPPGRLVRVNAALPLSTADVEAQVEEMGTEEAMLPHMLGKV
jgi:hypothetical protein